jgi:hypothetical protein
VSVSYPFPGLSCFKLFVSEVSNTVKIFPLILLCYTKIAIAFLGRGDAVPDFVGAPYEFWVGGSVGVGTSVGQIRVTDALDKNNIGYDLLHSYHDGGKNYLF